MTQAAVKTEIQSLAPSAILEFFSVDLTSLGDTVYNFHAGTNGLQQQVVWQGVTYLPFPCQATGFEYSGNGQLPRPKLTLSNVSGSITGLVLAFSDCVGAKVTRRRTMQKFLDAVNFPGSVNPTADPTCFLPDDIYYIDRKSIETKDVVEFELASILDQAGVQLPRRQIIQNLCPWRYRGSECSYAGTNYYAADDTQVFSAALDVCGKRLSSCKKRFGATAELPFGGFPGAGLTS